MAVPTTSSASVPTSLSTVAKLVALKPKSFMRYSKNSLELFNKVSKMFLKHYVPAALDRFKS